MLTDNNIPIRGVYTLYYGQEVNIILTSLLHHILYNIKHEETVTRGDIDFWQMTDKIENSVIEWKSFDL